jgi:broad specificity phosphatase PhoE
VEVGLQVLLVRHAATVATARRAFPADEPISADVISDVVLPADCAALSSPALRCRQTADALGLRPAIEQRLAECDFGSWAGRTLDEIDPDDAAAWIRDPDAAPHGGESLTVFAARVAGWLDEVAGAQRPVVAVTHAGVIRAAVVHARGARLNAFWDIDPAPLSVTALPLRAAA